MADNDNDNSVGFGDVAAGLGTSAVVGAGTAVWSGSKLKKENVTGLEESIAKVYKDDSDHVKAFKKLKDDFKTSNKGFEITDTHLKGSLEGASVDLAELTKDLKKHPHEGKPAFDEKTAEGLAKKFEESVASLKGKAAEEVANLKGRVSAIGRVGEKSMFSPAKAREGFAVMSNNSKIIFGVALAASAALGLAFSNNVFKSKDESAGQAR